MIILKRVGERGHPCLSPLSSAKLGEKLAVSLAPIRTLIMLISYITLIKSKHFSLTPNQDNLANRASCGTVSYAFLKSMNVIYIRRFAIRLLCRMSIIHPA